jgi:outer membrane lipoprotein SlyB
VQNFDALGLTEWTSARASNMDEQREDRKTIKDPLTGEETQPPVQVPASTGVMGAAMATVGAAVGGVSAIAAGATAGSAAGPIGTAIGAAIGAVAGNALEHKAHETSNPQVDREEAEHTKLRGDSEIRP